MQHGGALTADFYRYYGDSPRRLCASGVPLFDVADMAANLPPDSAVARAIRGPSWWVTPEVEFMREIEYSLRVTTWLQSEDGSKGRNQPTRIPLPGDEPDKDKIGASEGFDSIESMDEFFADDPWFANVQATRN